MGMDIDIEEIARLCKKIKEITGNEYIWIMAEAILEALDGDLGDLKWLALESNRTRKIK
jgi:hypothetical protein